MILILGVRKWRFTSAFAMVCLCERGLSDGYKKSKFFKIKGCAAAFIRLVGLRGCFMVGVWGF